MSRRESRVSMGAPQNDALFEFETFKKKFLLANKHITKLNSTLSIRIEELNAQISTLYVENLRLRESKISLSAQLKKEREKSRKIIAEAETATASLSKHLVFLRQSFNIRPTSPSHQSPPPPRARRPALNSVATPALPRLSRPPNFPGICEEDEFSSANECPKIASSIPKTASPSRRKVKTKSRLSTSRLPLPARSSPPLAQALHSPPVLPFGIEVALTNGGAIVKKSSRRQSGLISADTGASQVDRPPSPAFGSPIRREFALDDDGEVLDGKGETDDDCKAEDADYEEPFAKRAKRKGKGKERAPEKERQSVFDVPRPRDREGKREREEDTCISTTVADNNLKLKDVTNSPRSRSALPALDLNAADRGRHHTPDTDVHTTAIATAPTTSNSPSQLPTPRASSSPVPIPPTEIEASTALGRERRARKSVNYAEPKLNTKMRKPDSLPGTTSTTRKRSSAVTLPLPQSEEDVDEPAPRSSLEYDATPKPIRQPSSSAVFPPLPVLPLNLATANPSSLTTRVSSATTVKRKKSRPTMIPSDDESDGAQADVDADFGNTKGIGNGWLNVERRRRSTHVHGTNRAIITGDVDGQMTMELHEGRRHSVAV